GLLSSWPHPRSCLRQTHTRVESLQIVPPWLSNPTDSPFRAMPESGYPFAAKVGQFKPPKWASSDYRNHPSAIEGQGGYGNTGGRSLGDGKFPGWDLVNSRALFGAQ